LKRLSAGLKDMWYSIFSETCIYFGLHFEILMLVGFLCIDHLVNQLLVLTLKSYLIAPVLMLWGFKQ
jgi:hypothetical protein